MRPKSSAVLCVLLSLAGLILCAYLGFIHIALLRGEFLGGAACRTSGSIFNCHAVTGGSYGNFLDLPLAFWGLLGYLATFTLALIAWQFSDWTSKALSTIASLAFVFVLLDIGLLALMVVKIRYLCPLCLASYAVNLLLLWVARAGSAQPWRIVLQVPKQLWAWRVQRAPVTWILWGILVTGVFGVTGVMASVNYMQQGAPGALRQQIHKFLKEQKRVTVDMSGDPLMAAPRSVVQIVEFSDFLCPSCQRASKFNPIILAGHREDVSFVFKHFPLDSSCNSTITRMVHQHACELAAATECAHEQGKFWPLHDRIFEQGSKYKPEHLERDAKSLGLEMTAFRSCRESGRGLEAVKRDIAEGARLGVSSTPSYYLNGVPVVGMLSPAMFEEFFRTLKESGS